MSTVEVTRSDDGDYTAMHAATGASAEGETEADALAALAEVLRAGTIVEAHDDPQTLVNRVSGRVQRRVREKGADEDIVKEAIEWARSE